MMKRSPLMLLLFFLLPVPAMAQVEGGVSDAAEKAIPGAIITAADSTGRVMDSVVSDKRGFYSFQKLRVGKYRITAKAAGFKPAVYENVVVLFENTPGSPRDISGATRLEIVMMKN